MFDYLVVGAGFAGAVAARGTDGRDPREAAVAAWALVHGLAQLGIDGMVDDPVGLARAITRRRSG